MILTQGTLPDALPSFVALYERAFGRKADAEMLCWRHLQNPNRDFHISSLYDRDAMVASFSISPASMAWGDAAIQTGLGITSMVAPEYEGQGLYLAVVREATNVAAAAGTELFWAFPNSKSHYLFTRLLGWSDVCEIATMRLELSGLPASAEDWPCDDSFELDYHDAGVRDRLHVKKDAAFLRWRYASHPRNAYKNFVLAKGEMVTSYCVVKQYKNDLEIVDFQARREREGRELLRRVIAHASSLGLSAIRTWAPVGQFTHSLCEEARFVHAEPITYLCISARKAEILNIAGDPRNWFIQMGDSDVY